MAQAKHGDAVKAHYTGKLEDGTVFGSSVSGDPAQFTIGEGRLIPGFEQAVVGMSPGESKTVTVPVDEAYGSYLKEKVLVVNRNQVPANIELKVGQRLQIQQPDGRIIQVGVTEISESKVTLDANSPLAGKDLTFDIQLLEIV